MLLRGRTISLDVTHNIEVAHRLLNLPGKCQNIHGHSMQVTMTVSVACDENGYGLGADGTPLDFGKMKKLFRRYLDEVWDHHLHLNMKDPWSEMVVLPGAAIEGLYLPGLVQHEADPSVENICWEIKQHMETEMQMDVSISISETGTNGAMAL